MDFLHECSLNDHGTSLYMSFNKYFCSYVLPFFLLCKQQLCKRCGAFEDLAGFKVVHPVLYASSCEDVPQGMYINPLSCTKVYLTSPAINLYYKRSIVALTHCIQVFANRFNRLKRFHLKLIIAIASFDPCNMNQMPGEVSLPFVLYSRPKPELLTVTSRGSPFTPFQT